MVPGVVDGIKTIGPAGPPGGLGWGRKVDCWIPGSMVEPDNTYFFVVYANDTSGKGWKHEVLGWQNFYPTIDYFGWFMMLGYWDPTMLDPGERQPVDPINWDILTTFLGSDMPTLHRLWPLRAGIEWVGLDGSNAH